MLILYMVLSILVITAFFVGGGVVLSLVRKTEVKQFFIAFGAFFAVFGVSRIFYHINDFVNSDVIYWWIAQVLGLMSAVLILFALEVRLKKTKFIFTMIGVTAVILMLIPFPLQVQYVIQIVAVLMVAPFVPALYFYVAIKSTGDARKHASMMAVGTVSLIIGLILHGRPFVPYELVYFMLSPIFFVASTVIMVYGLYKSQSDS